MILEQSAQFIGGKYTVQYSTVQYVQFRKSWLRGCECTAVRGVFVLTQCSCATLTPITLSVRCI